MQLDDLDFARAERIILCLCIGFGIGLMAGGPGTIAKVSGLLLGLVFALFASPIIMWVAGPISSG